MYCVLCRLCSVVCRDVLSTETVIGRAHGLVGTHVIVIGRGESALGEVQFPYRTPIGARRRANAKFVYKSR